jgi:hypothetical protein
VLYEITVGKRLFRGTAADVVERLVEAKVEPPTFVRRDFPSTLESVVMRCLERHPDDRYQSAYDLADDLEAFLRDARMHSGPVRIARYLDSLTAAAGGQRRPELVSEAESATRIEELVLDPAMLDGFRPDAWEDVDQPDTDVAAALGLPVDELRELRESNTNPVPKVEGEVPPAAVSEPAAAEATVPVAVPPPPMPPPMAVAAPTAFPPLVPPSRASGPRPVARPPGFAQRLPWILVGALGVAVLALVAYIVMT